MRTSPPRGRWGSGGLFGIGIGIGIGIERFLRVAFDSDGDTDADTDACGEGSRSGSSWFLTVSGPPLWNGVATSSSPGQHPCHGDEDIAAPFHEG
jgi:hypothetical protein